MKDGYKETEIGVLPEDWEVVKINDIANYVGSGTTPRGGSDVYKTEGITFIRSQNVYPNKLVLDDVVYIDEATNEKMKRTILQDNDVLLNITGASIGRTAVLPPDFGRSNVNQHVCIIRLKEFFLPIYLSQFINSSFGRKQIDSYNGGSSREGLNFKQVRDILVTAPPLPEQRRIAEILSATDAHLEKLETIIADTQLLKKGIMQSLLTRGIGHTEFKDTEIGEIPKAWEIVKLSNVFKVSSGYSLSQNNLIAGIYPVYGGNGINGYHNEYLFSDPKIVIGRVGAKCGCIHITEPNSWITDNALYITEKITEFNEQFMFYKLSHLDLNKYANHNAQPVISGKKIYSLKIPLPPLSEQHHIAEILTTIDDRIQRYEKEETDFIQLKKGLMDQLLTGEIRVHNL